MKPSLEVDPPAAPGYFQAIEDHFIRLRGAPLILSPQDWHLAASWKERGIPLRVVLRAITAVFSRGPSKRASGNIHSLAYCRRLVEAEFSRWAQSGVGVAPALTKEEAGTGAAEQIAATAKELQERLARHSDACRRAARRTAAEMGRIAEDTRSGARSLSAAEDALLALEHTLLEKLEKALAPAERLAIRQACENDLLRYRDRMTPGAYRQTFCHAVQKELRRHFNLPRLSVLLPH
ncbi:MAG: hypothetical protein ACE5HD_05000 [Acidobacteriota bacterium]